MILLNVRFIRLTLFVFIFNRLVITAPVGAQTVSYSFDSLNRLTFVSYSNGGSISYGYDKGGNRILLAVVAPNRSPAARDDALGVVENEAQNAPVAKLLANDSDPDGDILTIVSVTPASPNGAFVVLNHGLITYTPASGFSGQDQFTYTVSDGRGGTDVGTVIVTVRDGDAPPLNQAVITVAPEGKEVRFSGVPGENYVLQAANLIEGPWNALSGSLTAGPTGLIDFKDIEKPAPSTRFYRIVSVP